MNEVRRQIEAARQRLLDLTMRNRLLNYRPTRAKTIQVLDGDPCAVYSILVDDERVMRFMPVRAEGNVDSLRARANYP